MVRLPVGAKPLFRRQKGPLEYTEHVIRYETHTYGSIDQQSWCAVFSQTSAEYFEGDDRQSQGCKNGQEQSHWWNLREFLSAFIANRLFYTILLTVVSFVDPARQLFCGLAPAVKAGSGGVVICLPGKSRLSSVETKVHPSSEKVQSQSDNANNAEETGSHPNIRMSS